MSMEVDIFADTMYGKAALKKIAPTDPNFRLYSAGFIGESDSLEVKGAIFREAKSGPHKGSLHVLVKGTIKRVIVRQSDMAEFSEGVDL